MLDPLLLPSLSILNILSHPRAETRSSYPLSRPSSSPFLRNPIPIPLSRCSALIQDDDREMGKFGEIKAKGKIDRNSPSFLLCEFAPRSFAFLLLPRNFLCVWLVDSRLFSPAPQLKRILMSQHSPSLKVPMGLGSLTSLFLMLISRNQFHCFDSTAIIFSSVDDSFLSCSCTTSLIRSHSRRLWRRSLE